MVKFYLILALASIFGLPAYASDNPKEIIEKRCSGCHNTSIIYNAPKSKAGWENTIRRMIRYGAFLEEGESETLIKYLTEGK